MAASYPGSVWAGQVTPALQSDSPTHSEIHDRVAEETVATQAELGVNPSGASATVAARFDVHEAAWTSYTPTLTNATLGAGGTPINTARYHVMGKTVNVQGYLKLGTSGSVSGTLQISLPFTSRSAGSMPYTGTCDIEDAGTTFIAGSAKIPAGNSAVQFSAGGTVNATVPMTWSGAAGDAIAWAIEYEVP